MPRPPPRPAFPEGLDLPLFQLSGLLLLDAEEKGNGGSVGGGLLAALAGALSWESSQPSSQLTAAALGVGGGASGLELLAVAVCGVRSSALLLRGTPKERGQALGQSAPQPLLRALPWPEGPRRRVGLLAFSPAGGSRARLLIGTADGGVTLLGNALQALRGAAPPAFQTLHPSPGSKDNGAPFSGPPVASLSWWRRRVDGHDVALAIFSDAVVRLWGAVDGALLHSCALGAAGGPRLLGAAVVPWGDKGGSQLLFWGRVVVEPSEVEEGEEVEARLATSAPLLAAAAAAAAAGKPLPSAGRAALCEACWSLLLEREEGVARPQGAEGERNARGRPAPGGWAALPEALQAGLYGFEPHLLPPGRYGFPGTHVWPPLVPPAPQLGAAQLGCHPWATPDGRGPLLSRYQPMTGLLSLFDPASESALQPGSRRPASLPKLRLPRHALSLLVTRRLVFVVHPREEVGGGGADGDEAESSDPSARGWVLTSFSRHSPESEGKLIASSADRLPPLALALQHLPLGPEWRLPPAPLLSTLPGLASSSSSIISPFPSYTALLASHAPPPPPAALYYSGSGGVGGDGGNADDPDAPPERLGCPTGCPVVLWGGACVGALQVGPLPCDALFAQLLAEEGEAPNGGLFESQAGALGVALGLDTAALYLEGAREALAVGRMDRVRELFARAGAPTEAVVACCLREGRSAEALQVLAEASGSGGGQPIPPSTPATAAAREQQARRLRLACLAHVQLSAWAATAAACALQAAPPRAAAAAAAAARAVGGVSSISSDAHPPSASAATAAAAAAAVAQTVREEARGRRSEAWEEEELAQVTQLADSACCAAAAAASIASMLDGPSGGQLSGLRGRVIKDADEGGAGDGDTSPSSESPGSASWRPRSVAVAAPPARMESETLLRLLLCIGRVTEALHAQGVVLAEVDLGGPEGEEGRWLTQSQTELLASARPNVEECVALRPGTPHALAAATVAAAAAAAAPGPHPPPPTDATSLALSAIASLPLLPLLSDEALMRCIALSAGHSDAQPHIAALLALAARAGERKGRHPAGSAGPESHATTTPLLLQRSAASGAQLALEAALVSKRGKYQPHQAALACDAWANSRAHALVLRLNEDWEGSMSVSLDALAAARVGTEWEREELLLLLELLAAPPPPREPQTDGDDDADMETPKDEVAEEEEALSPPTHSFDSPSSVASLSAALRLLVARWQLRELGQTQLEAALLARAATSGAHVCALSLMLLLPLSSPLEDDPPPLRFSGGFALRLAALRCAAQSRAQAAAHPLSASQLYDQVYRNMMRHAATPTAVRFTWPPPLADLAGPPGNCVVAFSCGHSMSVERLEQEALPALLRRLRAAGAPLSAQLVEAHYGQHKAVPLGCPACVERAVEGLAAGEWGDEGLFA